MSVRIGLSLTLAIGSIAAASAQPPKLPIAQGVWVKTGTNCNVAFITHVYAGNRFGTAYLYGPKQTMGPAIGHRKLPSRSKAVAIAAIILEAISKLCLQF